MTPSSTIIEVNQELTELTTLNTSVKDNGTVVNVVTIDTDTRSVDVTDVKVVSIDDVINESTVAVIVLSSVVNTTDSDVTLNVKSDTNVRLSTTLDGNVVQTDKEVEMICSSVLTIEMTVPVPSVTDREDVIITPVDRIVTSGSVIVDVTEISSVTVTSDVTPDEITTTFVTLVSCSIVTVPYEV